MACIPGVSDRCNPLGDAAAGTASAFLQEIANETEKAAADIVRAMFAGWLAIPSPGVSQDNGPVAYLRAYTGWLVAAVAVGAVLVAALRLALKRNGEEAGNLGKGLAIMVVLAGAGVPAVQLLLYIGDSYSTWILNQAADGDAGARIALFAPAAGAAAFNGLTFIAAIGIATMMWIAAFVQIVLLLGRGAALVLLSGLLPLAGAAGISGGGRSFRDRYLTWLLAMILYKPAAATIYAAAFWMLGKGQDFTTILTGVVTFAMAVIALPALMRLIAPGVQVLSSGGGGGAGAGAAAASGAQLASGAMRISQARQGAGRGSGGGGGAPVGAAPTGPASGGAAPTAGATQAGTQAAGTGGAAAAGTGAAAAAGPVGVGVMAAQKAYQAGPAAASTLGGTAAAGATGGEQQ